MIKNTIPVISKILNIFSKYFKNKGEIKKEKLNKFDKPLAFILILIVIAALYMNIFKQDNLGGYWFNIIDEILKYITS